MGSKSDRKIHIIAAVITVAIMSTIPLRALFETQWQKKLNTVGGKVGIVNLSDYQVDIHLFGHDTQGVVVREYILLPNSEVIVLDSMSKDEVYAFPPKGFVDSALLVFDDSVAIWHKGQYLRDVTYDDHFIHNDIHWLYESITVHHWTPRGIGYIYRPVRRYILTNEDYIRAKTTPSGPASVPGRQ